ncbi:hypothetical protein D3C75_1154440 [compost metagenome]
MSIVGVGGVALSQKVGQHITLRQQRFANARLAGQLFQAAAVGGQVETGEKLTAFAAMLFELDDHCLLLRQNLFQQLHVTAMQGEGFGAQ